MGNRLNVGEGVFWRAERATAYYLAGTSGWRALFCGRPAVLRSVVL